METHMCRALYTGFVAKSLILDLSWKGGDGLLFGYFQVAFGFWDTLFQDLLSFLLLFLMGISVVGTRFYFSWFPVLGFWINQETILKVYFFSASITI